MLLIPARGGHAHGSQRDHVVVEDILTSLDINDDFTSPFIVFSEFTLIPAYQRTAHHECYPELSSCDFVYKQINFVRNVVVFFFFFF